MKTMFLVESVAHKRGGVLLCLACNLIRVIYLSGSDFSTRAEQLRFIATHNLT